MIRDTITLAAFPKSGVTYLSSMLYYSLFPGEESPELIEKKFIVDIHAYPDADPRYFNGNRIIKSHFPYKKDDRFSRMTKKAIYLIRDPIDVMSSAYDFFHLIDKSYRDGFEDFANKWIAAGGGAFDFAGTWKNHVTSWTTQNDVPWLVVKYTDLVDRPSNQLDRIFSFCGIEPKSTDVAAAIERSSMAAMRAREEDEYNRKVEGVFYNRNFEESMSKGARFINKGYRNSRSLLSEQQKDATDRQFGRLIEKFIYAEGDLRSLTGRSNEEGGV